VNALERAEKLRAVLQELLSWPHAAEQGTMRSWTLHDGMEFPLILANPLDGVEPFDVRRAGVWTRCRSLDVHHYSRGQLLISCSAQPPALDFAGNPVFQFGAEVRVSATAGGIATIIGGGIVSNLTPPLVVPLGDTRAANNVDVVARQIVNGAPDGQTASNELAITVTGRVYR
jgi:hypothetical protein